MLTFSLIRDITLSGLTLCLLLAGCSELIDDEPAKAVSLRGVSLSPRSYVADDFVEFLERADEAGEILTWAGDWIQLGDSTAAPRVVAEIAADYNLRAMILSNFFAPDDSLLRPFNDSTRAIYLQFAADFAFRWEPPYMGFGNEINFLHENLPQEFDEWVAFFPQVYDAVKAASPSTKVFTVFQLERMKGLRGGLFGGVNDTTDHDWGLLDRFPQSDYAAFTTYPGLIYRTPGEIPADYYTSFVSSQTSKPVIFIETGWHVNAEPVGWEGSEAEQAEFVTTFFARLEPLAPQIVIWSFVYDQPTSLPFNSMGLRRADGTARPAWDAWLQ